jgi:hypothetical protein
VELIGVAGVYEQEGRQLRRVGGKPRRIVGRTPSATTASAS